MKREVKVNDILYHFNGYNNMIRECAVLKVDENMITIRYTDEQDEMMLLRDAIGKRLFFEKSQIEESFEKFSSCEPYIISEKSDEEILKINKIKEVLKSRKIKDVVHFTNVKNLASILEYGIIPRDNLHRYSIKAEINDMERYDCSKDCSSCSITFPNHRTFSSFRNQFSGEKWVVIILDSEILLSKKNRCKFCLTNAANKYMKAFSGYDVEHLKNMFAEKIVVKKQNCESYLMQRQNLPDNLTTDVQAEVLIEGDIHKKYIKKVIFETLADKNEWYHNNRDVAKDYFLDTIPQYFSWRDNFVIKGETASWQRENVLL